MACTGYKVIEGTTISSFDVQIVDVVLQAGQGPRILVSVSGPAVAQSGVAEGFSGSPVYCPDALGTPENIGAISQSVGQYGGNLALVTPIEQMLGEPIDPPASAPLLRARTRPLTGPLTIGGLSPSLMNLLQQSAASAGRQILDAPDGPGLDFPVQPLVPGASVAVGYSEGAIPLGAVGTVTYRDGPTVYAFGHELDGAGARSLLLQDAYVYDVIDNPDPTNPSTKLASPGHTEGTLTSDTPNGVIGTVGAPPSLIPVDVTATDLDTGASLPRGAAHADLRTADSARHRGARPRPDQGPRAAILVSGREPRLGARAAVDRHLQHVDGTGPDIDRASARAVQQRRPLHRPATQPRRREGDRRLRRPLNADLRQHRAAAPRQSGDRCPRHDATRGRQSVRAPAVSP
ncbi:MAG: hypothetical protein ACLP01_27900 [Solirubrobacteraceae bacterium]